MSDPNLTASRNRLSFSFTFIVFLGCILSLVVAQKVSSGYPWIAVILFGVATSLLASVIFARFYSWLVEAQNMKIIGNELSSGIRTTIEEIKTAHEQSLQSVTAQTLLKIEELERKYNHEISTHFRELIPLDYFPPSREADQRFNELINTSLEKTSLYIFKGVTGRHVPIRLELMQPCHLACKVFLIDPSNEHELWLYGRDRYSHHEFRDNQDKLAKLEEIRRDIFMTIIALFDLRWRVGVQIILYSGPIFYRTEIFDDYAVVSFLIGKTPGKHPVTYLYRRGTIYYDAFLTDIYHTTELCPKSKSVSFSINSTNADLQTFLTTLGVDSNKIDDYRKQFEKFRLQFLNDIREPGTQDKISPLNLNAGPLV